MPWLVPALYTAGAAIIGGSLGYSLNKVEDIAKLALIGGGIYLTAKAVRII